VVGAGGASSISGVATGGATGAAAGAVQPPVGAELHPFLQQEPRSHAEAVVVDANMNEPARIAEVMNFNMIVDLSSHCEDDSPGSPTRKRGTMDDPIPLARRYVGGLWQTFFPRSRVGLPKMARASEPV